MFFIINVQKDNNYIQIYNPSNSMDIIVEGKELGIIKNAYQLLMNSIYYLTNWIIKRNITILKIKQKKLLDGN